MTLMQCLMEFEPDEKLYIGSNRGGGWLTIKTVQEIYESRHILNKNVKGIFNADVKDVYQRLGGGWGIIIKCRKTGEMWFEDDKDKFGRRRIDYAEDLHSFSKQCF